MQDKSTQPIKCLRWEDGKSRSEALHPSSLPRRHGVKEKSLLPGHSCTCHCFHIRITLPSWFTENPASFEYNGDGWGSWDPEVKDQIIITSEPSMRAKPLLLWLQSGSRIMRTERQKPGWALLVSYLFQERLSSHEKTSMLWGQTQANTCCSHHHGVACKQMTLQGTTVQHKN